MVKHAFESILPEKYTFEKLPRPEGRGIHTNAKY